MQYSALDVFPFMKCFGMWNVEHKFVEYLKKMRNFIARRENA
jgi:hypothetical protein